MQKYALVINGEVLSTELPATGTLKNGSPVSGYKYLDSATLLEEGWLPLEDTPPEYDHETHYIRPNGYVVEADKVIVSYEVVQIPAPGTIPPTLDERVAGLEGDNLTALLALADIYEENLALKDRLENQIASNEADNLTALNAIAEVYEMILPIIGG